ncbi:MAG: hypothetical protein AAFU71_00700 [Cyanobacteria bacterium J06632_22]
MKHGIQLFASLGLILATIFAGRPAVAGTFSEDLSACLVGATSPADRTALMQWIFSAIAVHPDLGQFIQLTEQERVQIEQDAADIFQRLLTEDCGTEARAAFVNEGIGGVQNSLGTLGEVAVGTLFENPAVVGGLTRLVNYVDLELLGETLLRE